MRGSVGSVAPSGSLVAAGAGWGLGDDPALRTWSHLGSKVPALFCSLVLSLISPCRDICVPLPLVLGWRHKSCRGMRGGPGVWVRCLVTWGPWCVCIPKHLVRGQILATSLNAPCPGYGAACLGLPPRPFNLSDIGFDCPRRIIGAYLCPLVNGFSSAKLGDARGYSG